MQPRLIDGNRHKRQPGLTPPLLETEDLLQHVEIQLDNEAIALKEINKLPRHEEPQPRASPAHERLRTDTGMRADIVLWLVPYLELFAGQCRLHAAFNLLIEGHMLLQRGVKEADRPGLMRGQIGTAHGLGYRLLPAGEIADTCLQRNPRRQLSNRHVFVLFQYAPDMVLKQFLLRLTAQADQLPRARARAYRTDPACPLQGQTDFAQHGGHCFPPVGPDQDIHPPQRKYDNRQLRMPRRRQLGQHIRNFPFEPMAVIEPRPAV